MRALTGLCLVAAAIAFSAAAEEPPPAWVEESRSGAGELGRDLQQALKGAMEAGGPVAAVEVCRHQAPAIARSVSDSDVRVGRTALKVRNPDNAPDDWERRMMRDFERRLEAGEAAESLEVFAIRNDGESRQAHWMRAIPTQELCTTCHGKNIPEEVEQVIADEYPDDQARGFSAGDLRGAFTVRIDLDPPD